MEEYVSSVTAALKVREDARTVQRMGWPRHGVVERGTQNDLQGAYSCSVGRQPANRQSNRYTDVVAYDRTRVITPGLPGGHYLNANWVRERFGGKWTIATQAPLPATAHSFLSLFLNAVAPPQELTGGEIVAPQTPRTIVQLTQNVERRVTKASPYFPAEVGQKMTWTPQPESDNRILPSSILIELVATEQEDCWQHSTLRIAYANRPEEARLVRHLLFQVSTHVAICLSTVLTQRLGLARSWGAIRHPWLPPLHEIRRRVQPRRVPSRRFPLGRPSAGDSLQRGCGAHGDVSRTLLDPPVPQCEPTSSGVVARSCGAATRKAAAGAAAQWAGETGGSVWRGFDRTGD